MSERTCISPIKQPHPGKSDNLFQAIRHCLRVKEAKIIPAATYAAVEKIHFEGAHFRRDIAAKALGL
jgi:hypothetical protein